MYLLHMNQLDDLFPPCLSHKQRKKFVCFPCTRFAFM